MKVDLDKTFPLPGSPEVAWEFLQDVEAVAACMPGAKITEKLPDGSYKGTVTLKVGPATMSLRGELSVRDRDPATRSLRLLGRGTDSTGTSGASMDLAARIEEAPGGAAQLVGKSQVAMSGKAAAFGGRMMNSVADQVLKQFAANFAAQVSAHGASASAAPAPASAPEAPPGSAVTGDAAAESCSVCTVETPPGELDGLALLWAAFKDWLRGLFRSRAT